MSALKPCDVTDINSLNYHPYATCCGKCEKFEREKPYQARLLAQHIADAKQSEIEYRKKNMKRYRALKRVNATPMTRQEYNDYRGWTLPEDENGADEGYLTEDIDGPINTNEFMGYVSWTPKKMFDDQFYEIDAQVVGESVKGGCTAPQDPNHELTEDEVATLASNGSLCDCTWVELDGTEHPIEKGDHVDFGTALHLMELGERVQREGWNGKGMFVYIVPAASYPAQRNAKGVLVGDYPDDMVPYSAYIALKTNSGEVVPWTISQSDALATDWCLA